MTGTLKREEDRSVVFPQEMRHALGLQKRGGSIVFIPVGEGCLDLGLKRMREEESAEEFFFYTIQDPPLWEP